MKVLLCLVALCVACQSEPPAAQTVAPTPTAVTIDVSRKDLVFRYLDPQSGEVATATSVDAIPDAAKSQVVVYDALAEPPPGWDLVLDLTQGTVATPRQHFAFATRAAATPSAEKPPSANTPPTNGVREVVMFSTQGCGYCNKARKFLTEQRIPFSELDLDEDPAAPGRLSALGQRAGLGARDLQGVPIIFVDGQPILGWDQRRLSALLGIGG